MTNKEMNDLEGYSLEELQALIAAAQAKRSEKMEGAKAAFLKEMTERAEALGLTLDALLPRGAGQRPARGRKPRSDAGKPAAVKYRGPDGQEWSGRGCPPAWLAEVMKGGRSREDFRV